MSLTLARSSCGCFFFWCEGVPYCRQLCALVEGTKKENENRSLSVRRRGSPASFAKIRYTVKSVEFAQGCDWVSALGLFQKGKVSQYRTRCLKAFSEKSGRESFRKYNNVRPLGTLTAVVEETINSAEKRSLTPLVRSQRSLRYTVFWPSVYDAGMYAPANVCSLSTEI